MRRLRTRLRTTAAPISAPSLYLDFIAGGSFDPRITFSRGTTATYVGSNGLIQSAAINTPRFDYDPVTLAAKGLLIEEQRTNLLTYSEQFDNAAWTKTNSTVTANATTAPDGTTTADKLLDNSTSGVHSVQQNIVASTTAGLSYSGSVFVKAAERGFVLVGLGGGAYTTSPYVSVNLSTGAISVVNGAATAFSATQYPNGWWRVSVTGTTLSTGTATLDVRVSTDGTWANRMYVGDGSGIFIWGAQGEAGSFATSYIPTVASQVTRSADVATMTGTNFSSWYNQSEGTFVASGDTAKPSGVSQTANAFYANDGTSGNAVSLRFGTSAVTGLVQAGSVAQTAFAGASYTANTPVNWAIAYKTDDTALCVAGGTVAVDTSVTVPTALTQINIGARNSSLDPVNGHIRAIAYYNTRLTNTQLQALTA